MEKFHLRAVFLEEPSFVNLADPDTETGECKTNRAVRCRYKVARPPPSSKANSSSGSQIPPTLSSNSSRHQATTTANRFNTSAFKQGLPLAGSDNDEFEYKCCSGFCIDLMEKFATDLKFSYDLYR